MKRREDIQGLRAVAVLLVIFAHLGITGFDGGWIGVDVFFVISGFLITGLLMREYDETNHVSLRQFYLRRAKRILPAALVTILVVVIVSGFVLNSIRSSDIHADALWSAGFVSNIHFIKINADYFTSFQAISPLQHFWSLAVEEQFYFFWPALFLIVSRQHGLMFSGRDIHRNQRVLIFALIASAWSLYWSISYTASNPTSAYFSTLTRVWELGFGAILALTTTLIAERSAAWTEQRRTRIFTTLSWGGLAMILLGACVIIKPGDPFPGALALIPVLGAVGIIFGGLGEDYPLPNRILSIRPLAFIGTISFSLYLWHWPVHVFAEALYPDSTNTPAGIGIQMAIIVAISLASFAFIENPARHLSIGQRELVPKKFAEMSIVPFAALLVVCIGASLLYVVSKDAAKSSTADSGTAMESSDSSSGTSSGTGKPSSSTDPKTISHRDPNKVLNEWNQQLTDSVGVTSMTPELSNAIKNASNDKVYNNCVRSGPYCWYGANTTSGTVALMGDSHAEMIMATVSNMFPTWMIKSYAKSECPTASLDSLPGQMVAKRDIDACNKHNKDSIADILSNPPDVVIISDSLGSFSSPNFIGKWSEGQAATYQQLSALPETTQIIQLTTTPGSVRNGWQNCLQANNSLSRCFANPENANTIFDAQRSLIEKFPRITLIDLLSLLCQDDKCPPTIDGAPVYIEGNHFSQQFRLTVAPALGALIVKELPELKRIIQI